MLGHLIAYLRGLVRRRQIGIELEDELRFHLEQETETNVRRGMSAAEARRMAQIDFGGVAQTREAVGDVRAIWLDSVWRDVQLAVRLLTKQRMFTATVSATLAVCLAANAALFAIVDHVLLRPLPIPEADRIVITGNRYPKAGADSGYSTSAADYDDRLRETHVFEEQALFKTASRGVEESGAPTRVQVMAVTPSFFRLARVAPSLGRTFTDDEIEPGRQTKAVLSFGLWQSQFGGDPSAVGRDLRIDGQPYTIVGVMPKSFDFVAPDVLAWTPLALTLVEKTVHYNDVWGYIARLKAGSSIEQARAEIDAINRANLDRFPQFKRVISDMGFHTVVERLQDSLVKDVRPRLYLMWGGALFVLLIGCLNVANLVVARARVRVKELATRLALGAGRARLARQLITEGLVLAIGSAAAGLILGRAALQTLGSLNLQDLPRGADIQFDASTVAFTLCASAIVGVFLGVLPAVVAMPAAPTTWLNDEPRGTTAGSGARHLRRSLVALQVAVAFVLLTEAGLLFASFRRILAVDPGFESTHVLTASVSMPASRYREPSASRRFSSEVLARLRAVPSVAAAGATDTIPFGSNHTNSLILPEGYQTRAGESIVSPARVVASSGYMQALRARLIAGRLFDDHDVETAPDVAIVDQTLAARFWPGTSPIGRRLYRPNDPNDLLRITPTTRMFIVVGVITPMKLESLETLSDTRGAAGAYYFPLAQQPERTLTFAVRTDGDPAMVSRAVRTAIQSVDPELPVFDLQLMDRWMAKSLASRRAAMLLSLIFSLVALFLAAVGIYGVLAYVVAQRRKEIGIRLALGASARAVFALVIREGLAVAAVGLVLGAIGVAGLQRALATQLFGVVVTDPVVILGVSGLLASVAAAACALPAWRASRIDARVALSS
jgi:putative ABC transport system permease protein